MSCAAGSLASYSACVSSLIATGAMRSAISGMQARRQLPSLSLGQSEAGENQVSACSFGYPLSESISALMKSKEAGLIRKKRFISKQTILCLSNPLRIPCSNLTNTNYRLLAQQYRHYSNIRYLIVRYIQRLQTLLMLYPCLLLHRF